MRAELKEITVCFTGHRWLSKDEEVWLSRAVYDVVESLILSGVRYFGCGGAVGFDMLSGFVVLKLKEKYPHIELIMVLPCKNQDLKWNNAQKAQYAELLSRANPKKVYISETYTDDCMLKRNRYMVDASSKCIAFCKRNSGGSAYTVNYAKRRGVEVVLIEK